MSTKIHWADETINPVVGCSKISEGCQNCYAEKMARRLACMGKEQYKEVVTPACGEWNGKTAFVPSELEKPYKCQAPRSIFVSSMGDLFHKSVPFEWVDEVMRMIANNSRHTFIFLTKRPERMKQYFDLCDRELVETLTAYYQLSHGTDPYNLAENWPLPNLVLGVSVENQQAADERIPILLQIPAAKRFISIEPMIGLVDLDRGGFSFLRNLKSPQGKKWPALDGVILGGESGSEARSIQPDWVRTIRDQCAAANVPFMFKQWGEWGLNWYNDGAGNKIPGSEWTDRMGKKAAGNSLDGKTHTELAWSVRK